MKHTRRPFVAILLVLCLTAPLLWLSRSTEAQSPPPVDLSDDFNDNSLNTDKWNINSPGSPAIPGSHSRQNSTERGRLRLAWR